MAERGQDGDYLIRDSESTVSDLFCSGEATLQIILLSVRLLYVGIEMDTYWRLPTIYYVSKYFHSNIMNLSFSLFNLPKYLWFLYKDNNKKNLHMSYLSLKHCRATKLNPLKMFLLQGRVGFLNFKTKHYVNGLYILDIFNH